MNRRSLLLGLGALIAAPAVIRIPGLLMPVRAYEVEGPRWLYAAPKPIGLMNGDGPENAGSVRSMMAAARAGDHVILCHGDYYPATAIGRLIVERRA